MVVDSKTGSILQKQLVQRQQTSQSQCSGYVFPYMWLLSLWTKSILEADFARNQDVEGDFPHRQDLSPWGIRAISRYRVGMLSKYYDNMAMRGYHL
jgi:hypothetical protein